MQPKVVMVVTSPLTTATGSKDKSFQPAHIESHESFTHSSVCLYQMYNSLFTLHCSSSLSCMNEYLATDTGRYFCMNSLCASITARAARLNVSQRSRNCVQLSKSVSEYCKVPRSVMRTQ